MQNWIVLNRTDYLQKMDLALTYKGWYAIKPKQTNQPTLIKKQRLLYSLT